MNYSNIILLLIRDGQNIDFLVWWPTWKIRNKNLRWTKIAKFLNETLLGVFRITSPPRFFFYSDETICWIWPEYTNILIKLKLDFLANRLFFPKKISFSFTTTIFKLEKCGQWLIPNTWHYQCEEFWDFCALRVSPYVSSSFRYFCGSRSISGRDKTRQDSENSVQFSSVKFQRRCVVVTSTCIHV